jgi:hypothetical protein
LGSRNGQLGPAAGISAIDAVRNACGIAAARKACESAATASEKGSIVKDIQEIVEQGSLVRGAYSRRGHGNDWQSQAIRSLELAACQTIYVQIEPIFYPEKM